MKGWGRGDTYHDGRDEEQRSADGADDDEHVHSVLALVLLPFRLLFRSFRRRWRGRARRHSGRGGPALGQRPGRLRGEDGLDEALDFAAGDADVEEGRIGGLVLGVDLAGVLAEDLAHQLQVLRALPHQLAGLALGDLDVALEHGVVLEAELEGRDGHALRDGDEVEDGLLLDTGHVEEAVFGFLQGEEHHFALALEGLLLVLGQEDLGQTVDVLAPDLARPEVALVVVVFPDVADDVGLLQELAHALHQLRPLQQDRVGQTGLHKQPGETLADQTSDVVAVQLVIFDRVHTLLVVLGVLRIIGHTIAHPLGNVPDNNLVRLLHRLELPTHHIELNQKLAVLLIRSIAVKVPSFIVKVLVELAKHGLLSREGNGHVILDGIQTSQDEVEQADGDQQFRVQLLNDGGEGARRELEQAEALLQVLRLLVLIALVHGLVPQFPLDDRA